LDFFARRIISSSLMKGHALIVKSLIQITTLTHRERIGAQLLY